MESPAFDLTEFHAVRQWYADFVAACARPAFATRFDQYFLDRGIRPESVTDVTLRLTAKPDPQECEWFFQFMHSHRLNKEGGITSIEEGILWKYPIDETKYGKFGRARAFTYSASFLDFFRQQGKELPKCLSPRKDRVPCASHLFILPKDAEHLKKSHAAVCFIEGEGKTVALSQNVRLIEDNLHLYAAVGMSGVEQAIPAPEFQEINWRNRVVYLFFDADAVRKPQVAHAELKLYASLIAKGARVVKSCTWPEIRGNGYDDYSVNAERKLGMPPAMTLHKLIGKAKSPLQKYAPGEDGDGFPLETICRGLAKCKELGNHHKAQLVGELAKIFKPLGLKSKDIEQEFNRELAAEAQEAEQARRRENAQAVKSQFGITYQPVLPEGFEYQDGHLTHRKTPLARMFVISKYIEPDNTSDPAQYLLGFRDKQILIQSDEFSNYHRIAEIFNRQKEIVYDSSARLVQEYISKFWTLNKAQPIPIVPFYKHTGWDSAGNFRLPSIDQESVYADHIKAACHTHGDAAAHVQLIRDVFLEHDGAGLILLFGFAAPLMGLYQLPNYIVFIHGNPGDGKSTAAFLMLALYGNWNRMFQTMNASKVGKEMAFALHKDIPVVFDEVNTAGNGDGKMLAQEVMGTLYGYASGKGKTRGTQRITLRDAETYQGLLCMTSERSLETIFSMLPGLNIGGAYRRTIEFPVWKKHDLWQFDVAEEKTFFNALYERINGSFGHVGAMWLQYIADPAVQTAIKLQYKIHLDDLGKSGTNLKGTDNLFAMLLAIEPHVGDLLGLPKIWTRGRVDMFERLIAHQQAQINYQLKDQVARFKDALQGFISMHPTCFSGVCPAEKLMTQIFGRVEDGNVKTHIYLRPEAFKKLCNDYGFDRGILSRLEEDAIFKPKARKGNEDGEKSPTSSMRIAGVPGQVYHFELERSSDDERSEEIAQNSAAEKKSDDPI